MGGILPLFIRFPTLFTFKNYKYEKLKSKRSGFGIWLSTKLTIIIELKSFQAPHKLFNSISNIQVFRVRTQIVLKCVFEMNSLTKTYEFLNSWCVHSIRARMSMLQMWSNGGSVGMEISLALPSWNIFWFRVIESIVFWKRRNLF